MPLALTARDIVHVLISGVVIVVVLNLVWPRLVHLGVRINQEYGGETVGERVYILAGVFIIALFTVLVRFNDKWGLWDSEPAVTAVVMTIAIMFGYGQLMTSSYLPRFELSTSKPTRRLTVPRGQETPVKLVVRNTSIMSWGTHRISLQAEYGEGITFWSDENRKTQSTMSGNTIVQKNSGLGTVGEPSNLYFNVKAEKEGNFRLRVRVSTGLRPGEKQNRDLWLVVKDATQHTV